MDEQSFLAQRTFPQYTQCSQLVKVARGRLTLRDPLVHHVSDTAIRLLEDHVDTISAYVAAEYTSTGRVDVFSKWRHVPELTVDATT
jgi:hypothetical protein